MSLQIWVGRLALLGVAAAVLGELQSGGKGPLGQIGVNVPAGDLSGRQLGDVVPVNNRLPDGDFAQKPPARCMYAHRRSGCCLPLPTWGMIASLLADDGHAVKQIQPS